MGKEIAEKQYILQPGNPSILEVFTSISRYHQEIAGASLPENLAWMVLDWKLRVPECPQPGEICTARTWVREYSRACSLRDYELLDASGKLCAYATSRWAIADLTTRKMIRITPELADPYGTCDKAVISNAKFIKNIGKGAEPIKTQSAQLTSDMFDGNHHLHNTVYSALAESIVPADAKLNCIDISYRKEIQQGRPVILEYYLYNGMHAVKIKTDIDPENVIVLFGNEN